MSTQRAPAVGDEAVESRRALPTPRRTARQRQEQIFQRVFGALVVVAVIAFIGARWLNGEVRPTDTFGNAAGIVATALLVLAMLYAGRRRTLPLSSKRSLGLSRTWLLVHIYGSLLFLVALFLHSGGRLPQGLLSWALWLLSLWTVTTGLLGLLAQRLVPRLLTSSTTVEAHYDRIPALVSELRQRSDAVAAGGEPPLRLYYSKRMAPALAAPANFASALTSRGRAERRLQPLEHLRSLVTGEERERVDELERLYSAKLDLDVHYAWQTLLRTWLWLHVPTAVLLTLLVLVHIATVIAY